MCISEELRVRRCSWVLFCFVFKGEVETATGVLFFISAEMKQLFVLIGCVSNAYPELTSKPLSVLQPLANCLEFPFSVFSTALLF